MLLNNDKSKYSYPLYKYHDIKLIMHYNKNKIKKYFINKIKFI